MKRSIIKYLRLSLILLLLGSFTLLTSQIYFLVTNSNLFDINLIGQITVGFENNELEVIEHNFSGVSEWGITDTNSYAGVFSIQSGLVSHNEQSTITISLNVLEAGHILFSQMS